MSTNSKSVGIWKDEEENGRPGLGEYNQASWRGTMCQVAAEYSKASWGDGRLILHEGGCAR